MDGSTEISGLLSNVQDIEVLTDHVINIVRTKMRETNSIRVKTKKKKMKFILKYFRLGYNNICSTIC